MKEILPGTTVELSRTITAEDVTTFGELSQDHNRIHFDESFAAGTLFQRPVAHGLLGAALISGALTRLMGDGNIWLDMNIRFVKPIYLGDTVTCKLSVEEINRRRVVKAGVRVINQDQVVLIEGAVTSMSAGTGGKR